MKGMKRNKLRVCMVSVQMLPFQSKVKLRFLQQAGTTFSEFWMLELDFFFFGMDKLIKKKKKKNLRGEKEQNDAHCAMRSLASILKTLLYTG